MASYLAADAVFIIELEKIRSLRVFSSWQHRATSADLKPVYGCCQLQLTCLLFPSKQCSYCGVCPKSFCLDFWPPTGVPVECVMEILKLVKENNLKAPLFSEGAASWRLCQATFFASVQYKLINSSTLGNSN